MLLDKETGALLPKGDMMNWVQALKVNYKSLSTAEKQAADYLLAQAGEKELAKYTLRQCAAAAGAGQQTIVRCLHKCGFGSWKEFLRCVCAGGSVQVQTSEQAGKVSIDNIPAAVAAHAVNILADLAYGINQDDFRAVIKCLRSARMIDIYGVECSVGSAVDLAGKLLYLGMNCRTYTDMFFQKVSAEHLSSRDVAIGISQSGQSRVTVEALRSAKAGGAVTVAITGNGNSTLTEYADYIFVLPDLHPGAGWVNSRVAQVVFNDMLYQALLLKDEGCRENIRNAGKIFQHDII